MQHIDLEKILIDFRLDPETVASSLFPYNRYPLLAFKRLIRDSIPLDLDQLERLAKLIGIEPVQLLQYNQDYSEHREATLIKGPFVVSIKPDGYFVRIDGEVKKIASLKDPIIKVINYINELTEQWNLSESKSM